MGSQPDEGVETLRDAAREDLATARRSLGMQPLLPRSAAFHAQQAVEKLMKAALLAAGEDYPLIHNLGILNERLAAVDLPEIDRAEADFLTPYAGLPRYGTGPTEVVAKRALELAEKICARLEEIIDEALAKDGPEG